MWYERRELSVFTIMPKSPSTSRVVRMYGFDSSFPITVSIVSFFAKDAAKRMPEMNWEETSPFISMRPPL